MMDCEKLSEKPKATGYGCAFMLLLFIMMSITAFIKYTFPGNALDSKKMHSSSGGLH